MAQKDLPPELLQALIALSNTRSPSPSSDGIDLAQPSLGPLIDRFQNMVGAPLFEKTSRGVSLTEIGEITLDLARRALAANDESLRLGASDESQQVRLGINSMLLDFFLGRLHEAEIDQLSVVSDTCSVIVKAFHERTIDVAMVLDVKDHRRSLGDSLIAEFDIDFAWIQARQFAISPAKPVPLSTWPADQLIFLDALRDAGRPYRICFSGPDYFAKFSAVRSGRCVTVVPRMAIASPFVEAKDPSLPPIPPKKVLLGVRGDPKSARLRPIVAVLSSLELMSARDR